MFDSRRFDKYVATLQIGLFDALHALHINVQDADASRSTDIGNSFLANTVQN